MRGPAHSTAGEGVRGGAEVLPYRVVLLQARGPCEEQGEGSSTRCPRGGGWQLRQPTLRAPQHSLWMEKEQPPPPQGTAAHGESCFVLGAQAGGQQVSLPTDHSISPIQQQQAWKRAAVP